MKKNKKNLTTFKRNELSGASTIKGGATKRLGMTKTSELTLKQGVFE